MTHPDLPADVLRDGEDAAVWRDLAPLRWVSVDLSGVPLDVWERVLEGVRKTNLPAMGDAKLVWVNEGDLYDHSHPDRRYQTAFSPPSPTGDQ